MTLGKNVAARRVAAPYSRRRSLACVFGGGGARWEASSKSGEFAESIFITAGCVLIRWRSSDLAADALMRNSRMVKADLRFEDDEECL